MSVKNLLLLSLLNEPVEAEAHLSEWPEAESAENKLLFAMYLAKTRQGGAFRTFLADTGDLDVTALSQWCLFIGLSDDLVLSLALFDTLKAKFSLSADVWGDLATLQAASGYNILSSRSLAIHAALTGRTAPVSALPLSRLPPDHTGGAVRFVYGDASNFSGV